MSKEGKDDEEDGRRWKKQKEMSKSERLLPT